VSGQASLELRVELADRLLTILARMDLDPRERISVLVAALVGLWADEHLPIELWDGIAVEVRNTIVKPSNEPKDQKPS